MWRYGKAAHGVKMWEISSLSVYLEVNVDCSHWWQPDWCTGKEGSGILW